MDVIVAACHLQTLAAPRRVEHADVYAALDRECRAACAATKGSLEALRDRALEHVVLWCATQTADPRTQALASMMAHNRRWWPCGPALPAKAVERALEEPRFDFNLATSLPRLGEAARASPGLVTGPRARAQRSVA